MRSITHALPIPGPASWIRRPCREMSRHRTTEKPAPDAINRVPTPYLKRTQVLSIREANSRDVPMEMPIRINVVTGLITLTILRVVPEHQDRHQALSLQEGRDKAYRRGRDCRLARLPAA